MTEAPGIEVECPDGIDPNRALYFPASGKWVDCSAVMGARTDFYFDPAGGCAFVIVDPMLRDEYLSLVMGDRKDKARLRTAYEAMMATETSRYVFRDDVLVHEPKVVE